MKQSKKCVQCPKAIPVRAVKCPHCGVLQPELAVPVNKPPSSSVRSSVHPRAAWAVSAVSLVVCLAIVMSAQERGRFNSDRLLWVLIFGAAFQVSSFYLVVWYGCRNAMAAWWSRRADVD